MARTPTTRRDVFRDRITGHDDVDPAELIANPHNFRRHSSGQKLALTGVLDTVGWVQGVIVNQRTGTIVDGHLRAEVARDQGLASIPVTYVELTEEEERLILATFNPIGELAGRDAGLVAELLGRVPPQEHEGIQALLNAARADAHRALELAKDHTGIFSQGGEDGPIAPAGWDSVRQIIVVMTPGQYTEALGTLKRLIDAGGYQTTTAAILHLLRSWKDETG